MSKPSVKRANEALARYYKQHGRDYYIDPEKKGRFAAWAEENGYETDGILDEFQVDPEESIFTEIDEEFPGSLDDEGMIAVIRKCWDDPKAYTNDVLPLQVTAQHWKVDDKDIKRVIEEYEAQCKNIFNQGMKNDKAIIKLLAVGANCEAPYLQYLADSYSRDRILSKEALLPSDWAEQFKHLAQLKKLNDKTAFTEAVTAVGSFFHRIVPKLMLNAQREIVDSLEETAKYIAAAVEFVGATASDNKLGAACPFQYDACIAFNETRDCSKMMTQGLNNDDEDDEDDEDDDDQKGGQGGDYYDCFGNIKEKIKKEKLLHEIEAIDDDEKKSNLRSARLYVPFQRFKNNQIAQKYGTDKTTQYPRKHRFCSIIDRRKKDKAGSIDGDEIIFFEPPNNCNTFPDKRHVPLWYFDASRTCIIPSVGYKHGEDPKHLKNLQQIKDQKEKIRKMPTTSQTPHKGALMILSFHVEAVDVIRCYLYLNGQIIRFMPSDIIKILPKFFVKSKDNEDFKKSQTAKDLIAQMEKKLVDKPFSAFYDHYK